MASNSLPDKEENASYFFPEFYPKEYIFELADWQIWNVSLRSVEKQEYQK